MSSDKKKGSKKKTKAVKKCMYGSQTLDVTLDNYEEMASAIRLSYAALCNENEVKPMPEIMKLIEDVKEGRNAFKVCV